MRQRAATIRIWLAALSVISTPQGPLGVVGAPGPLDDRQLRLNTPGSGDVTLNYYFSFQSNIWAVYETDGTTGLQLINWGPTLEVLEAGPLTTKSCRHFPLAAS